MSASESSVGAIHPWCLCHSAATAVTTAWCMAAPRDMAADVWCLYESRVFWAQYAAWNLFPFHSIQNKPTFPSQPTIMPTARRLHTTTQHARVHVVTIKRNRDTN